MENAVNFMASPKLTVGAVVVTLNPIKSEATEMFSLSK